MNELYQKSALDFTEDDHRQGETSELISGRKHARAIRVSIRWALAFSLLCCCCMWVVSAVTQFIRYWPSERERDVAELHGLAPTVETTKNIREAQSIADSFRAAHLTAFNPKNKYAKKVTDEHGHIDYIPVQNGCEATVMLVRHCEKGDIREHCSYQGFERSVYLASLFGNDQNDRWPLPSYIFALSPAGRDNARKMNFREIETVEPLATKAGVTIDDSYPVHRGAEMATEVLTFLQSGQMCGKLTVISWKHSEISHLARKLGCGPFEGCPMDYKGRTFDDVWQIKYVYRIMEHSDRKNLKLARKPSWNIYGSVQSQNFDPLQVSKRFGDYIPGGKAMGGSWKKAEEDVPERETVNDANAWRATHVGFGA